MKKRILSLILAVMLIVSMTGLTAMAQVMEEGDNGNVYFDYNDGSTGTDPSISPSPFAFNTSGDNTTSIEEFYTLNKNAGTDDGTKDYYVEIEWIRTEGIANITGDTYHWDASQKKYVRTTQESGFTENQSATVDITIRNYSNAEVNYAIAFEAEQDVSVTEEKATDSQYGKTGKISAYITASDSIENADDDTGAASYTHTGEAPSVEYKGTVTLNSNENTKSAVTGRKVGTYTVTIKS